MLARRRARTSRTGVYLIMNLNLKYLAPISTYQHINKAIFSSLCLELGILSLVDELAQTCLYCMLLGSLGSKRKEKGGRESGR